MILSIAILNGQYQSAFAGLWQNAPSTYNFGRDFSQPAVVKQFIPWIVGIVLRGRLVQFLKLLFFVFKFIIVMSSLERTVDRANNFRWFHQHDVFLHFTKHIEKVSPK